MSMRWNNTFCVAQLYFKTYPYGRMLVAPPSWGTWFWMYQWKVEKSTALGENGTHNLTIFSPEVSATTAAIRLPMLSSNCRGSILWRLHYCNSHLLVIFKHNRKSRCYRWNHSWSSKPIVSFSYPGFPERCETLDRIRATPAVADRVWLPSCSSQLCRSLHCHRYPGKVMISWGSMDDSKLVALVRRYTCCLKHSSTFLSWGT